MLIRIAILCFTLCTVFTGCKKDRPVPAAQPATKPNSFKHAKPIELQGCPNLHKVSDSLYRGGQPTKEGFKNLEELGIKTVINLRTFHSDKKLLKDTSLNYVSITMQAWEGEVEEVIDFLKVINNPENHPVFVHCLHGADRTGTMVAVYRIVMQDWEKQKAIDEMTRGGYNYHKIFKNLPRFIRQLDTEEIKKSLKNKPQ